jgi:hypothetical protein
MSKCCELISWDKFIFRQEFKVLIIKYHLAADFSKLLTERLKNKIVQLVLFPKPFIFCFKII